MSRPNRYTLEEKRKWCSNCVQGRHGKYCKKERPTKRTGEICTHEC